MKSNGESKELALHYFKTLVEVARESFLILDANLRVVSGNPTFYQNFKVTPAQTEGKLLFDLGNGQWNILELKRLLKEVLPERKVVRDYEVTHLFEKIGERTVVLNARQIDSVQLMLLAIEDSTYKKNLEGKLAAYTEGLEKKVAERTSELANKIKDLEKMNRLMIGRELKMTELKKEIEILQAKIRKPK